MPEIMTNKTRITINHMVEARLCKSFKTKHVKTFLHLFLLFLKVGDY